MSKPGFVIAATGLAAEARIAERSKSIVTCVSGGREERLRAALNAAISGGTLGVISFGIAGALAPELRSGDIVIGTAVVARGKTYDTDSAWTDRLTAALTSASKGTIAGSPVAIGEPDAKAALYRATSALAADMESQVVAQVAEERGLPFAVLRIIADSANERLPPAAITGLKPDGTPDIVAVMKSLAGDPTQIGSLIRVAFATRRAMAALFRCHRLLGPGLGFADLG